MNQGESFAKRGWTKWSKICSDHFAHFVLGHGFDDLPAILLTAQERLGEFPGLIRRDLAGQPNLTSPRMIE
jgi:hypothetical protein